MKPGPRRHGLHALRGGAPRPFALPPEIAPALRHDGFDHYRAELYEEVRRRFGPAAADHLVTRLGFSARAQVTAWHRRASYIATYPALLDPSPLAVDYISPARLLKHAFGTPVGPAAVLVRFRRGRDPAADRSLLVRHAPWFLDLPRPDPAVALLRLHGWLLFSVEPRAQAGLLEQATMPGRRLSVAALLPETLAAADEAQIRDRYLPSLLQTDFDRCLE